MCADQAIGGESAYEKSRELVPEVPAVDRLGQGPEGGAQRVRRTGAAGNAADSSGWDSRSGMR
jgi:hypothetical protein